MDSADRPEDRLRASWDANAPAWTRAVREGRIASRREGTDAAVLSVLGDLAPGRVLDVGCGEGWLVHALARRGMRATGVDASRGLLEAAREAGPGAFLEADYRRLVEDPSIAAGPFDVLTCNFSLLGAELDDLLASLARRLAPGGRLVIQTVHPLVACRDAPYRDGWREEDFVAMGEGFAPMPWYFRTVGSWIDLLRRAGLRLERLEEPVTPAGRPLSLLMVAREEPPGDVGR